MSVPGRPGADGREWEIICMIVVVYSAEACLDRWMDGMQQREQWSAARAQQAVRDMQGGRQYPGANE